MKTSKMLCSISLLVVIILCISCKYSHENKRLEAVKIFADNVLEKGHDRWSGHNTPLLADGINVNTGEPIEYVYDGQVGVNGLGGPPNKWIIHNLASQQNLFRTLVGLTNLTGNKKYRNAAEKEIKYHFDSLRSESGLLRWGGHQLIDLRTLKPIGHAWRDNMHSHELKDVFPYYELMWDVNKDATTEFLRAFWKAHVLNWGTLEFNRHGGFGIKNSKLWESEFKQQKPFFEADGLTFLNTGSDLIYAGGMLDILNGEEGALKWSKLLADQYVRARHPKTGLGAYQFSKPTRHTQPPEGPLTGLLTFSSYGDRAENQFGKDFPGVALEGWALFDGGMYTMPALMQMELAERLGEKGKEYLTWTLDGLKAYAKYAYNPGENTFHPMWADGTDLANYTFSRTGYYGPQGRVLKPLKADEIYLFSYARAYRLSKDQVIWEMVRSITKGLQLGDPGAEPGKNAMLNMKTENSNPYAIFALLEVYRASQDPAFLKLAEVIGDNILKSSYKNGFFLTDRDKGNARFDAIQPLALLSLEATLRGKPELVPVFSGGSNHLDLKTE
jgi:pectate lyase